MRYLLAAISLLLLAACTSGVVPPTKNASSYFLEGEAYFDKGLYKDAIASWEKARESYYSSELNILLDRKIAEAHFAAENYLEAAMAFEDFLKQHPGNQQTNTILYQLGMSYYNQIASIDRDQTATKNALATFKNLLARYPEDSRAEEVRHYIEETREKLAEHELYVGRFYLQYRQPEASIRRLNDLLTNYPEFAQQDQAYLLLGQAYLKAGHEKEGVEALNKLVQEFPSSEYVAPAQKLMAKLH